MIIKKRLGVNIDHVATIRNARGVNYPSPLRAALIAEKSGADSITIHLREDRRHIIDYDLAIIKKKLKIPLNLEMAPTKEMLNLALKYKPDYVCVVPEKRSEITTEGGLNLLNKNKFLKGIINSLKAKKIRVSLFIEPTILNVLMSKELGADCVELHTGKYCNSFNIKKKRNLEINRLKKVSLFARNKNLGVHAGHGLTYKTAKTISRIKYIEEFNIGHFIVSEAVFVGLKKSIKIFKNILNNKK
jgi:pyridoxine 5-phosphate synthase